MAKPKDYGHRGSPYCACTDKAPCLMHYGMEKLRNGRA